MKFLALSLFLFIPTAFAGDLECKITDDGEVALVHYLNAVEGDLQQMVHRVGKETWQNPNHARPKCEEMKTKYIIYKGERWSRPYCICAGNFQNKDSVFASLEGDEIVFEANNWFNRFRGFYQYESFKRELIGPVPNCERMCP